MCAQSAAHCTVALMLTVQVDEDVGLATDGTLTQAWRRGADWRDTPVMPVLSISTDFDHL